jgi:hypothetical protein
MKEGEMDFVKELVSAAFGFALGFLSHLFWDCKNRKREKERQEEDEKKEDKRLLLEARKILLEILRMWKTHGPSRPFSECMDDLSQLSAGIKRKENEIIKLDIWKFSGKFSDCVSIATPETKEMRKEAEKLQKKIEAELGIVDHEKNDKLQGGSLK